MIDDPTATPIDVHGTAAWVVVTRDRPLAALTMTYAEANKLQADLRRVCTTAGITLMDVPTPNGASGSARFAAAAVFGPACYLEQDATGQVPRKPAQRFVDRAMEVTKVILEGDGGP